MSDSSDSPPTEQDRASDLPQDMADQLERVLDLQISLINDTDTKAEHVTRLVGILLGVILTALSISFRFNGGPPQASLPTSIAFGLGLVGLLVSMLLAIITYLSSQFELGLHSSAADALVDESLTMHQYSSLVANTYASAIERNKPVLKANATRFRYTLSALLLGIGYLTISIFQYTALHSSLIRWIILIAGSILVFAGTVYILRGDYLTLERE